MALRLCCTDALKRKTFGKTLIEHPVIRLKIAEMARQVECTHAQLENITYQVSDAPRTARRGAPQALRLVALRCAP